MNSQYSGFDDKLFDDKLCKFIDYCMSDEPLTYDQYFTPENPIQIPPEIPVGVPISTPKETFDAFAFPTSTMQQVQTENLPNDINTDTINNIIESSIPIKNDYINDTADAIDTFEFFKNFYKDQDQKEEDPYNDFLNYNMFCSVNIKNNVITNKFHSFEIHKKHKKLKSTLPFNASAYYQCLFNGCRHKFSHTDGVKKHAKKKHPEWITGKKPEEYAVQIILFSK